ncbi:hypothetical protein [Microbacterium sp. 13-71-7]|uniref:hypothetical protein n=1 Tax=Microbacterium sp. 13-71-7 TaxID=1970399 RepID=UPI000BD6D49D|nr:hypothetical protein [Microbacterium sp. 13-71-7]OZB82229.1 MAG: hypothetical protein B7X32_14285 [Microbacterium sp. 13-71-7]
MKRSAMIIYTVAGLAIAGLVALAAPPVIASVAAAPHVRPTTGSAQRATPHPTVSPTSDPDRVIWLGDGISVKVSDLPKGCTTYSKIQIFDVSSHSYGRLIGEAADRGASEGATGTVNRDAAGNIVSYTAAPGDNTWSVGDRLCTNGLMIGRYNHVGTDPGDHALQPGETMVIRPDMNVEWVPGR